MKCTDADWVPYDASISPIENLFDNPDNLDPQPEYPLRTALTYGEEVVDATLDLELDGNMEQQHHADAFSQQTGVHEKPSLPPMSILLVLWVFGLFVWFVLFSGSSTSQSGRHKKKRSNGYKDV